MMIQPSTVVLIDMKLTEPYTNKNVPVVSFSEHVAYRNTELGSWFVRKIVKVFLQKAHQDDVASMFTVV